MARLWPLQGSTKGKFLKRLEPAIPAHEHHEACEHHEANMTSLSHVYLEEQIQIGWHSHQQRKAVEMSTN